jgi:formylglycine-generating enzyme required for sulfatase activity/serine/threonine protein kinase
MEHEFDATAQRGSTRAGEYDLLRKMGAGGFGTVFEARHRLTGLPYAVKRIYLSPEDAERFRNEAIYPARIASDSLHVLGVHSFFHDETVDAFYLVTELIAHGDLRAFLDRQPRPLPLGLALDVGLGIAKGLSAIHAQRIVHRDLKPANVLMDRKDGQWVAKITDFGLARSISSVTIAQFATSGYASPEQLDLLSDKPLGPESDLFSYGMVLYELLTGAKPTDAQGLRDYGKWLGARQLPPAPSAVRRELGSWPALDWLIARLLDFDRSTRLASAAEVVRVLDEVRRAVTAPPPTPVPAPAPPPLPSSTTRPLSAPVDGSRPAPSPAPPPITTPQQVIAGPIAGIVHGAVGPSVAAPEPRWRILLGMTAVFAVTAAAMYLGLPWESATRSPRVPPPLWSIAKGDLDAWFALSGLLLPALFGLAIGLAARLSPLRVIAVGLLSVVAYNLAVGPNYIFSIPNSGTQAAITAAALAGAVFVRLSLALVRWQRPTVGQVGIVAAVGLAGGVAWNLLADSVTPFWLGVPLAYAAWQIPVGLAIVDGANARAAGAPRLRWAVLAGLAAVAIVHATAASWRRSTLVADRPGSVVSNPIDRKAYAWIPPGTFTMGCSTGDAACASDERPTRSVRFTRGFWLAQDEVRVVDWKRVIRDLPPPPVWRGRALNPDWSDETMPIVNVGWAQARDYCAAIDGRLPTEAEWEYAARAGTTAARYSTLADIAWYADNTGVDPNFRSQTLPVPSYQDGVAANRSGMQPVATRRANAWGLRDMLGNVAEWVEDDYRATPPGIAATDPSAYVAGITSGASKAIRGASWYNRPSDVRVSARDRAEPNVRYIVIGFRCVWNRPPDGT